MRWPNYRPWTQEEAAHAAELYRAGLTIDEVGRKIGRPFQTVRSRLLKDGVTLRHSRGTDGNRSAAAEICTRPIGDLPSKHPLQAVDRAVMRARAVVRRLDVMRASSGFPAAAVLLMLALSSGPAGSQQYFQHQQRTPDPYMEWKWLNKSGNPVSCRHRRDCMPVPYRWQTGEIQLPGGEWVDPLEYRAADGVAPTIYWSDTIRYPDLQEMAHACIVGTALRCVGLPGSGV